MKKFTFCFLVVGLAMQLLFAQQSAGPKINSSDRLSDDDGGVVQIVPADVPSVGPARSSAAPVMKSVRQVNIFLGAGWAEQNARSRERTLSDLSGKLGELQNSNTAILPPAPSVEDFTDLTKTPINDLAIQHKLAEMLNSKAIPAPDATTVYLVFLAPGIKSTVGGHVAGVHYAAYHTAIHLDGAEIRYVVVPFSENADHQLAAASRALIETAFNPGQ